MPRIRIISLLLAVLTTSIIMILYLKWSSQSEEIDTYGYSSTQTISLSTATVCFISVNDSRFSSSSEPMIYFITPTYPRREQVAELTRLGQTLMHVLRLHWIVADDNKVCNSMITRLLAKFGVPYTHISSPMPEMYRSLKALPKGVANRQAALDWIRTNAKSGVLYFGDDDNTFDLKLFEDIRYTNKVSMFPVGLIGDYGVSAPVVKEGKVVGFYDPWPGRRKFSVDMAGFAVNVEYFMRFPNATMTFKRGYEENNFLLSLNVTLDIIEPKAENCTQIMVWHTQTKWKVAPVLKIESYVESNLRDLLEQLSYMGMAYISNYYGIKTYMNKDGNLTAL